MAIRITYQNPSISNGVKITMQDSVKDEKTGKMLARKGAVKFVKPRNRGAEGEDLIDFWLDAAGKRSVILEELPT